MKADTAPLDLIVQKASFTAFYQVLPGKEALYFARLGVDQDPSSRTIQNRIFPSGDDATIRLQMRGQKGFCIPWEEIESVHLRFQAVGSSPRDDRFGTLTIRTKGKRRLFHLIRRGMMPDEVIAFFAPVADVVTVDLRRYEREEAEMAREKAAEEQRARKRNPALTKTLMPLRYALLLTPMAVLFLRLLQMPYRLYLALSTALALLPMALCIFLPQYFSIAEEFALRRQRRNENPSVVLTLAIALGCFAPTLGAVNDFSIMDWGRAALCTVLFGAVMSLLMTRGEKGKRIWLNRALLSLWIAAFSLGIVLNLNVLLDFREPTVRRAVIAEQRVTGSGHTSYELYFSDLPRPVLVSQDEYDRLTQGASVMLVEHAGAFGIRYVDAWTLKEWVASADP